MDKKRIYIAVLILLALGWAITLGFYVKAQKNLTDLQSGAQIITNQKDAFAVCDNINSPDQEQLCIDQLIRFSGLLKTYQEKLQNIKVQG